MRPTQILIAATIVALGSVWALAAPADPPAEYVQAMQELKSVEQGLDTAVKALDFEAVQKHAQRAVIAFAAVQHYWKDKSEDAFRAAEAGSKSAADLGVAADLRSPDGIEFSAKEVMQVCGGCHAAHREERADKTYQIK
jgi:hypothetical protein